MEKQDGEWVEDKAMARKVEKLEKESKNKRMVTPEDIIRIMGQGVPVAHMEKEHFTKPEQIVCKYCGSKDIMKYGVRNGVQNYICRKCGRKFTDKDTPFYMRTPTEQIGASLNMYYDGLSLSDIAQQLAVTYNNPVAPSTVYLWLIRYTNKAIALFEPIHPKVGDVWIADETAIKFQDKLYWIWDIMDSKTRFLLATYLSPNRGTREARILMELASKRADKVPQKVITDKLKAYIDGIELVFGSETRHVQSTPFAEIDSTNIIERFQGTIKERTKVVWGFKTVPTARLILNGFGVHYNFFRPHLSLGNKTPAEVAGINASVKNWTELVRKGGT